MLLRRSVLEGIAAGEVTLAFRRWKRPTVRAGGRLRTVLGQDTARFKPRVRRLKELGLTESLEDRLPPLATRPLAPAAMPAVTGIRVFSVHQVPPACRPRW